VELWSGGPRLPRSFRQLFRGRPRVPIQHVFVRHPQRDIYGGYPILAHSTSEASLEFWVQPPIRQPGQDLVLDVFVIDHFRNSHRVRRVTFRGPRLPKPDTAPPTEPLHSLSDPLEKDVAAVLKNELTRYRQCGRPSGGLGSVTVAGSPRVPTEYRELNVTREQYIVPSPADGTIHSDNVDALFNRYGELETDKQRDVMRRYLLTVLSKSTEYAPVSYLILVFFHRIGHLAECLKKARLDLQGDVGFGFSDLLRLLDLLLRHEHHTFKSDELDEIERFLEGSKEHAFHIRERIAAVRAARIRHAPS
jgi:hypothetical protein